MAITQAQYYANAREIHAFWLDKAQTPIFASAMLAQADAESTLDPSAISDNHEAFGLHQLHLDRIRLIRDGNGTWPGCGIDVSKLPPVAKQLAAVWWELQHSEMHALKMIREATTVYDAGFAASAFYERPASATQHVKRGKRAMFWADYFQQRIGGN
jgi:hypothetical protein